MNNNEIKIKLNTPEDIISFTDIVLHFNDDIDVVDGSKVVDAKSLMGVCALAQGKEVTVRILTDNYESIEEFKWLLRKFEVK